MKYRLECLTPVLVGDGAALSPIDYMVWKDQVNVLNQMRIAKLLSKSIRLEGYLAQVKKAEKLDFASWGGFAQNYAGRRIPFEHASSTAHWEKLRADLCHIPTFARSPQGAYLPGSALRGALRTTYVASKMTEEIVKDLQQVQRRLGDAAEQMAVGGDSGRAGQDPLKALALGDSSTAEAAAFKVYLVRTATMLEAKGGGPGDVKKYGLGWQSAGRPAVEARRVDESTPEFVEMATPGTVFEGAWIERAHLQTEEARRGMRWRETFSLQSMVGAANAYAALTLEQHRRYALWAGLPNLIQSVESLTELLAKTTASGNACLVSLGWGGGLLGKTAWPKTGDENYRRILSNHPFYARAIRSGLPFPKTRRIVFLGGQPAALPGWALLEVI